MQDVDRNTDIIHNIEEILCDENNISDGKQLLKRHKLLIKTYQDLVASYYKLDKDCRRALSQMGEHILMLSNDNKRLLVENTWVVFFYIYMPSLLSQSNVELNARIQKHEKQHQTGSQCFPVSPSF
ncbi:hypothetical protein BdWA1_002633 [Babesia duncani]|uniref:Uncharacterized protein n=1 Tax=Babesia duncani TaxID=323732 RepID=A0AAD9PJW1_9APIC|nr:hypothetical protein BdWA1_002633 [Babesia duncani]